jgi:serine phosphatase RsbU (regulator of sigma subunit)
LKYSQLLLVLILVFSRFPGVAQDAQADTLSAVQGEDSVIVSNPMVDSLKLVLLSQGQDTARVNTLNAIAGAIYGDDPDGAISYGTEAKNLAERLNYPGGLALANKNIGLGFYFQGKYTEVLKYWEPSLEIYEELGDEKMAANIQGNLGAIYYSLGEKARALEYYLPALKMAEKLGDTTRIGTLMQNIGIVYQELPGAMDTARNYLQRAIEIGEALSRNDILGVSSLNLGNVYMIKGEYDSAMYYLNRSLTVNTSPAYIATALNYMGNIHNEKGEYQQAIETYNNALDMAEKENSQREIVGILLGLAATYENMDDPEQAIGYYKRAESIGEEIGLNKELSNIYEGLATNYAKLFDYNNAYKYLSLQNTVDNAYYRIQSDDETSNLLFNYQLDKKQDEIAILEQQKEIDQLLNRRQKAISIAVGLMGLFILAIALAIYNRMRFIRKTNQKINQQKEQITDSINYAQRIQSAILPSPEKMDELLPDHFILFKPKDIVSGDFYWIKEVDDHLIIVGADCTGHGVPGAFMSVLGITMFNDLIGDRCYDAPGAILDKLREKVKEMLVQQGNSDEQKDGMDLAIAVFNRTTRELHFSGANNPLYIIREKSVPKQKDLEPFAALENGEYRLFEIKGDKQPIGAHWEETPFRTTSVYLKERDSFYMFSDGYIDQFGGEERKKFKSMNFKRLLLSVQHESMEFQKLTLERTFEKWKGDYEQIDDISVLGVRI